MTITSKCMSFTPSTNRNGGEYKHQISVNEMPTHRHKIRHYYHEYGNGGVGWLPANGTAQSIAIHTDRDAAMNVAGTFTDRIGDVKDSYLLDDEGGNQSHNNIQPYFIVYFWRRTK